MFSGGRETPVTAQRGQIRCQADLDLRLLYHSCEAGIVAERYDTMFSGGRETLVTAQRGQIRCQADLDLRLLYPKALFLASLSLSFL